jgi:hypothetical protein
MAYTVGKVGYEGMLRAYVGTNRPRFGGCGVAYRRCQISSKRNSLQENLPACYKLAVGIPRSSAHFDCDFEYSLEQHRE